MGITRRGGFGGYRLFHFYGVSVMTRTELKMILKLIDLYTVEEFPSREIYDKIIRNVSGLKRDITELFEDDKDNERKETV